ncbi:hypothetical protein BDZ89DRAFT_1060268 [Hymenopellis radicata]|nr:hypothetical protein BDZ89DRAFT_1060268 [Hymenopellis radicata]
MSCSQRRSDADTVRNICGCTTEEINWTRAYGLAAITIPEAARRRDAARPRVSDTLNPRSSSIETEKLMHLTRGWVNLGPQSRSSAYTPAAADKGHVENNTDGEKLRPTQSYRPHSRHSAPDPDSTLKTAVTPTLHDGTPKIATRGSEYVGAEEQEPGSAVLKAASEVPNESNPSVYSCQHPQIVAGHLMEMRGVRGGGGGDGKHAAGSSKEENTHRHHHRRL